MPQQPISYTQIDQYGNPTSAPQAVTGPLPGSANYQKKVGFTNPQPLVNYVPISSLPASWGLSPSSPAPASPAPTPPTYGSQFPNVSDYYKTNPNFRPGPYGVPRTGPAPAGYPPSYSTPLPSNPVYGKPPGTSSTAPSTGMPIYQPGISAPLPKAPPVYAPTNPSQTPGALPGNPPSSGGPQVPNDPYGAGPLDPYNPGQAPSGAPGFNTAVPPGTPGSLPGTPPGQGTTLPPYVDPFGGGPGGIAPVPTAASEYGDITAFNDPDQAIMRYLLQSGIGTNRNNPWVKFLLDEVSGGLPMVFSLMNPGAAADVSGFSDYASNYASGLRAPGGSALTPDYNQLSTLMNSLFGSGVGGPPGFVEGMKAMNSDQLMGVLRSLLGTAGLTGMNPISAFGLNQGLQSAYDQYGNASTYGESVPGAFFDYIMSSGLFDSFF